MPFVKVLLKNQKKEDIGTYLLSFIWEEPAFEEYAAQNKKKKQLAGTLVFRTRIARKNKMAAALDGSITGAIEA